MYLVVGLGNPGEKYEKSRHNAGFMFLDRLVQNLRKNSEFKLKTWELSKKLDARHLEITSSRQKIYLLKPSTYMNSSGVAVSKFLNWKKGQLVEKIFLVYDDLDISLGEYKIGENYPKTHNGVISVVQNVGTAKLVSIRLGTDNRVEKGLERDVDFVLDEMTEDELALLFKAIDDAIISLTKIYLIEKS